MDLKQYWPQIGSGGDKPDDGQEWGYNDTYYASHLNYIWNGVRQQFGQIGEWISDVEDGTISVAEADYASDANATEYKGSDIDSDGDGRVDTADHAVNADSATEADHAAEADTADHATTADDADYATEAGHANTADNADTADSVPVLSSAPSNPNDGDHWIVE